MLSIRCKTSARGLAFVLRAPSKQKYAWRFARLRQPVSLAVVAFAIATPGGCTQTSPWARPFRPPTGIAQPANVNAYPPGNPPSVSSNPGFMRGRQTGQYNQAMRPTGPAGPVASGQPGAPEVVPTPRPQGAPPAPPAIAPCPPGQVLRPLPPWGHPVPKWRGFLPADDTREDRPGWWTPDYGGGTSA